MDTILPQCNALGKLIAGETVNYIPINNTAALNKKLMVVMKQLVKKTISLKSFCFLFVKFNYRDVQKTKFDGCLMLRERN